MEQGIDRNQNYILVTEKKELLKSLTSLRESRILAVDTETTGLDPFSDRIRLLQIAVPGSPVVIFDFKKLREDAVLPINELLSGKSIKVFQNAKFDLKFLNRAGISVKGQIFDTMLAARLLRTTGGPFGYGLDDLAKHYLKIDLPKEQQTSDWSGELTAEQLEYAARDAAILLDLREVMLPDLKFGRLVEVAKIEFDCIPAVAEIELNGMLLDSEKWAGLSIKLEEARMQAAASLKSQLGGSVVQMGLFGEEDEQGINLDSQQQVLKALRKKGIQINNTSREELSSVAEKHPVIKTLLDYRKASKAIQSFIKTLPKYIHPVTGRIHSDYHQIGTSTGRFSCSNPNLQQIPRSKEFRSCFTARPGYKLVIADYSQIELRVAAEISQDKTMIEAYRQGQDLHRLTASLLANKPLDKVTKEERQAAKAVNFGLIFAMGARGLQAYARDTYGVEMTLEQAETFRRRFFEAYTGIARWHKSVKSQEITETRTICGRRKVWRDQPGITNLYNTPVQGSAADIAKKALGTLVKSLVGTDTRILGMVHDEILLEAPEEHAEEAANLLKKTMELAGAECLRSVPVVAETIIADNWAEK